MTYPATHTELHGEECRRLKALGYGATAIGKSIGISASSVRYILADPVKRRHMLDMKTINKHKRGYYGVHHTPQYEVRVARVPPKGVPAEDIMAAARAFAAFEIDRTELMRRITP